MCRGGECVPVYLSMQEQSDGNKNEVQKREKIGSGLGLVMGLIAFNLIALLISESKEISDMNRMIGAMVSVLICSELGARVGKWLDRREQS